MKACIRCSCTDDRACNTEHGPCFWVSEDPPICSGCLTEEEIDQLRAEEERDGKLIQCAHNWLYDSPTTARCVHCKILRVDHEDGTWHSPVAA